MKKGVINGKEVAYKEKSPTPPERWSNLLDGDPPDFYGERGCCLTCKETDKDNMVGVEFDIWFGTKHYDCMCWECKCTHCLWYNPNPQGHCEYQSSGYY